MKRMFAFTMDPDFSDSKTAEELLEELQTLVNDNGVVCVEEVERVPELDIAIHD